MSPPLDVLIVGAGPAGLGAALALDTIDNLTFGIVALHRARKPPCDDGRLTTPLRAP